MAKRDRDGSALAVQDPRCKRMVLRDRTERIGMFRAQQKVTRHWIEIDELVNFLSSPKGPNNHENKSARDWFDDLKSSFEDGELGAENKIQMLFLCPKQWEWGRLTGRNQRSVRI